MLFYVQSFLFLEKKSILIKNISVKNSKISVTFSPLESQDVSNFALHFHYISLANMKMFENQFSLKIYPKFLIYIMNLQ